MPTYTELTDAAGSSATPYALTTGDFFYGNLASRGDKDWIKVNLVAGKTYTFALTGDLTRAGGINDTFLSLLNAAGGVLAVNDDATSGYSFSTLTFTCRATGAYYLQPGSYGNMESGNYILSMTTGTRPLYNDDMGASATLMTGGSSWSATPTTPTTVTFGFRETAPTYVSDGSNTISTFSQLTDAEKQACREALMRWSEISGITFQEVDDGAGYTNNATILFSNYSDPSDGAGAFAYYADANGRGASDSAGDVYLNLAGGISTTGLAVGSWSFFAVMHELGHALGLSHPGPYNAGPGVNITYSNSAQFRQDSNQYTLMSYFEEIYTGAKYNYSYADTPLLYDITAAQALYGINTTTRTGDTVYGYNSNAGDAVYDFTQNRDPVICIWDADGVDTLDASGFSMNQTISLVEGSFSNIGGLTANVSIAYHAVIENAVGGAGADTITGNSYVNVLTGNGGADTINGGGGDDTLSGGAGNDTLNGGDGADTLNGGDGSDKLNGGAGVDAADYSTASAAVAVNLSLATLQNTRGAGYDLLTGIENLIGSIYNDTLTGNAGANPLSGGVGNDILVGGLGNDLLDGGADVDTANYSAATAGVRVNLGLTTAQNTGAAGIDTLANIENLVGSKYADTLTGDGGTNVIAGGLGRDVMSGGGGNDRFLFNAMTDTSASLSLADVITDFNLGDIIDLSGIDANRATAANDAFNGALVASFTGAGQLMFSNGVLYGNTNNDRIADFAIVLTGVTSFSAGSVIL